jgi:PAS domain-containing protein
MPAIKSSFLDKVLGRIGRLDTEGLQTVVQRLARERSFLETLFNAIEDGILVVDEQGRIIYFNQAVTKLIGLKPDAGGTADHQIFAGGGLAEHFPGRPCGRCQGDRGMNLRSTIHGRDSAAVRRTAGRRSERQFRVWR